MFQITYGDCCRRGFAHKSCMRRYALTSGYYLCCIWCRSKSFRDSIRLQSVFVPDRDAMWEKQRNAYRELHDRNLRCGESNCLCPNGRFYNKSTWVILSCKLCGCMGAHTKCLAGTMRMLYLYWFCKGSTFKLNFSFVGMATKRARRKGCGRNEIHLFGIQ